MAATIKIKNSSTAGAAPTASDLVQGELAVNVTDKRLFTENASGTVVELGTNPATLTVTAGATIQGLTVGKGAGAVSTNTAVGASALAANTTGSLNTAVGYNALAVNTTGERNDAFGYSALGANDVGIYNSSFGMRSLLANTSGSYNNAFGHRALQANTTGSNNVAMGYYALQANTTASNNTAVGYQAGYSNTTGAENSFLGYLAGNANTTGSQNTFIGRSSGVTNQTGTEIVAVGFSAMGACGTAANYNTAIGRAALNNVTGTLNVGLGNGSGSAITSGSKNTIIGSYSGNQGGLDIRTANNYIVLSDGDGNPRIVHKGSTGNLYLFSISSGAGTNAARYNTSTGEFTFDTSSARYKDNIRDSIYGLSHVMQMRSAQFEYKDSGRSDVGLIAEELDLIVPELVGKNADNQPDSVSYDRMVSVLVKAIQELKAEIDTLKGQA